MPGDQVTIETTQTPIVGYDKYRTVLTLTNLNTTNIIYFSDQGGLTTSNGFPIYPRMVVSLLAKDGDEPEKAYYGITAVASTLAHFSQYGLYPGLEDEPQEPSDGLRMIRDKGEEFFGRIKEFVDP